MKRVKDWSTGRVVDDLCSRLDVSKRRLALLLNMDPHTLLSNLDRPAGRLVGKTKHKILGLYAVILAEELLAISGEPLRAILSTHAYENSEGNFESVFSALAQAPKYSKDDLLNLSLIAYREYSRRISERYPSQADVLAQIPA